MFGRPQSNETAAVVEVIDNSSALFGKRIEQLALDTLTGFHLDSDAVLLVEQLVAHLALFHGQISPGERDSNPDRDRLIEQRPRLIGGVARGMKLLWTGEKIGDVLSTIAICEVFRDEDFDLANVLAVEVELDSHGNLRYSQLGCTHPVSLRGQADLPLTTEPIIDLEQQNVFAGLVGKVAEIFAEAKAPLLNKAGSIVAPD